MNRQTVGALSVGSVFRDLHRPGDPFILANGWDIGSAKVLAALGAAAIGTTSAGYAFTRGLPDGARVPAAEMLGHAASLAAAVPVPVSADLENGYADTPDRVAETVAAAAAAGLAGCSIEDTALPDTASAYPFTLAVDRIGAAVEAARAEVARLGQSGPGDFMLVARADGVMIGAYDLAEAIRRIKAFEAAGADCVYVPVPGDEDALAAVVRAVEVPVNALAAGPLARLDRAAFARLGVARISLGSSLARMTHRTLLDAAEAMLREGRFDSHPGVPGATVDGLLDR